MVGESLPPSEDWLRTVRKWFEALIERIFRAGVCHQLRSKLRSSSLSTDLQKKGVSCLRLYRKFQFEFFLEELLDTAICSRVCCVLAVILSGTVTSICTARARNEDRGCERIQVCSP